MMKLIFRSSVKRHPFSNNIASQIRRPLRLRTTTPTVLRSFGENLNDLSTESFGVISTEVLDNGTEDQLMQQDLKMAINLLPEEFREKVWQHEERMELIELVLDYGCKPLARFPSGDYILSEEPVTEFNLHNAAVEIGQFDQSNRAGLDGTLHRISCIRDREDKIYGLTIRIGRALTTKTAALVEEPLKAGKSILLIGPPGVGKTSAIRNFCRVLSEECKKRVMIVDTSNEIAGPGRTPHKATGACRRMQVKHRLDQHNVMVEAVQNHTPEVIVIDEIGTSTSPQTTCSISINAGKKEECQAARSISRRGVQLVATTHGMTFFFQSCSIHVNVLGHTLENMLKDRILRELVGGVNNVIIGDDRAMQLGSDKKTILERVDASCFDVIVEMSARTRWRIHYNANQAVDAILSEFPPQAEIRYLDENGHMVVKEEELINPDELPSPDDTTEEARRKRALIWTKIKPILSVLIRNEANRILNSKSDLDILQAKSGANTKELKKCFVTLMEKLKLTQSNDAYVRMARARLLEAYNRLQHFGL
eukprot:g3505.t1